jgi:hypothetical protein
MRELLWDGYVNARDLGGLPARSASGCVPYLRNPDARQLHPGEGLQLTPYVIRSVT